MKYFAGSVANPSYDRGEEEEERNVNDVGRLLESFFFVGLSEFVCIFVYIHTHTQCNMRHIFVENGNTVANFIATAFGINMKYFM